MDKRSEQATSRIPLPRPEDLTPRLREDWEKHAYNRANLSMLLANSEPIALAQRSLSLAVATEADLPLLEREIVILAVLHLERGAYEIAQHREVARKFNIPDAKFEAIADHRYGDAVFTDRERALLAFTRQVVKLVRVDDQAFEAVAAFYSPRQIVETIAVIGSYMMLVRMSEVAELPIDGLDGSSFWNDQTPG